MTYRKQNNSNKYYECGKQTLQKEIFPAGQKNRDQCEDGHHNGRYAVEFYRTFASYRKHAKKRLGCFVKSIIQKRRVTVCKHRVGKGFRGIKRKQKKDENARMPGKYIA